MDKGTLGLIKLLNERIDLCQESIKVQHQAMLKMNEMIVETATELLTLINELQAKKESA